MCQYVVGTEAPLVVEDFLATEKFKDHYACVKYGVRFYAGVPLITSDGYAIGSLCLVNDQPREISEEQMLGAPGGRRFGGPGAGAGVARADRGGVRTRTPDARGRDSGELKTGTSAQGV
jgi:hypothetical protein